MPQLLFTQSYEKKAQRFLKKHPEIREQYKKALQLLSLNPQHSSLRLHRLKGSLSGLFSASINMAYRIVFHFIVKDDRIIPIDLGSHDEVY